MKNKKIGNSTTVYSLSVNTTITDTNNLYDKSTTEIMTELLKQSSNEYKFN